MMDDPAKFGDARNISMTMPQIQPASPTHTDSRPTLEQLAKANINPNTGLATDYLNHFNEAIMLLDLVATMPECLTDLMQWAPLTYEQHFTGSSFKERELAIAAYQAADPAARAELERLTGTMTEILLGTRDGMATQACEAETASNAAAQLRELIVRAGAVINGRPNYQVLFDTLFER